MSGAEDRRGSGEESGERAKESGERAKSSRKKEKEKTAEKEKSKETEKGKNKENETDQCKAGEKVTTGEDGQPAGGSNNANNTHDSPKKDASTDPLEDPDLIKTEELKDLLECPVCLRVPRGSPIYQCARGHVVCSDCRPNVSTCPQCRDPLGNIRSLVSEKMLEKLPAVCKFADNGCQVEMLRSQLGDHEQSCAFRLVNCVDLACQQRIPVSRLLAHLDNDHETEDFVRVEGGTYSSHFIVNEEDFTKSIMWISDQLHYDEKYFYRECCRSKEGLWYIWVYLLQTSQSLVTDYTCTISIKSADGEEELSCRCRPLSLDFTKEHIAESGRGLVFTDTTARHFWEENKVRYSVSIIKKANVEETSLASSENSTQ